MLRPSVIFNKGLDCSRRSRIPLSRLRQELSLYDSPGSGSEGRQRVMRHPEVEKSYTRARELCEQIGETPQLFSTLLGDCRSISSPRRSYRQPTNSGSSFSTWPKAYRTLCCSLEAHHALGVTYFWMGEFVPARKHLEQGIANYDPQRAPLACLSSLGGHERAVCLLPCGRRSLVLGYPDQALARRSRGAHTGAASCLILEPSLCPVLAALAPSSTRGRCRKSRRVDEGIDCSSRLNKAFRVLAAARDDPARLGAQPRKDG